MSEYREILQGSPEEQYQQILLEFYLDMTMDKPLFLFDSEEQEAEIAMEYIGKYCLFIYLFQEQEKFLYCADIKNRLIDLIYYRGFDDIMDVERLIGVSINQYKQMLGDDR
jgi:hypothetical protein